MIHIDLDKALSGHVWGFVFIFSRVGSIIMLFPGIGERFVPTRPRLLLALLISLLILEPLLPRLPAIPADPANLTRLIAIEVIIGLFYGSILRLLINTLEAAGTVIALQAGLSNAQILNPAVATQSTLPSALLSVLGTSMIFMTGLDLELIRSMIKIYDVFPPGIALPAGDMAQTIIHIANQSFITGVELAMPFFVIGMLFYTVLGIMQKMMPQIQLFLIAVPAQIWLGLTLLTLTVTTIMTIWLRYVNTTLSAFLVQ
jgi:flagellar biosynthetic protein FliR